ncbi:conserved hypothetical protein [Caldicellulosiruptor hydrothermalis 108]|uniref:GMT-like wHTH domain-containing protein n=1 Tax=Caldicellulosiruptor hydrothermalis (strain DSM 18901 / VKM B-2411 / 108) TaxID=632292 RepID=E4QDQ0_CALH1|nr:three-Cys-motif partner protein TcmP [Caldicellulosiruptor hydrothermalis]ADQ06467.1 conserved hypothetical protein [Caldicellulosiruptor hydrothermalis 108]
MFFEEVKPQSIVKITLVSKYFDAWAKIMNRNARSDRLGYIDLFSGPGKYNDGTISTPIYIMEKILKNEDYRNKFVIIFNDKEKEYIENLEQEINKLENINLLKHKPIFLNLELNFETSELFNFSLIPSLVFIDPCGYRGITRDLIYTFIKNWGCDIILFFNYNRIRSGIKNPLVEEHMKRLFGENRYSKILENIDNYKGFEKEKFIMNEFSESMMELGIEYILPFRFRKEDKNDTSHYLVFLTKNFTAFNIMKEIMANHSSTSTQGVPSFEFIPNADKQLSFLYMYNQPLEELKTELLQLYKGRSISLRELFVEHSKNKPFILRNYREVLLKLEEEGKIICDPPKEKRRKNTLAEHVIIYFL